MLAFGLGILCGMVLQTFLLMLYACIKINTLTNKKK